MKISELADCLKDYTYISLYKIRRYAMELLPPDPLAMRQGGTFRKIDQKDGFIIFLGIHLVTRMSFSMKDAKAIINDIKPWMMEKGLFPGVKFKPDPPAKDYDILIKRASTPSGFWYEVKGHIQKRAIKIQGQSAVEERYTETTILKPPVKGMFLDEFNVSILKISILFKEYLFKVGGIDALQDFSS
jgi:hypothetical protein